MAVKCASDKLGNLVGLVESCHRSPLNRSPCAA